MAQTEQAKALLRAKGEALGRLPVRSDFSESDVMLIKSALGPWPRALEAAGLKEPSAERKAKNAIKRKMTRKRRKTAESKEKASSE